MTSILELRESLETLLADQLGTYTLANGYTTPAISVRAVGEPMTPGTSVNGLELVIVRDPEMTPIPQYQDAAAFRRWTLYLVGWGADADLEAAAALIVGDYPTATATPISVPESVGPRHQMRLDIQTNPAG